MSVIVKLAGNTVFWRTSFTSLVTHSSTESELLALDEGATVMQALRYLIEAMGGPVQGKIQIFIDNTSTLSIATNPVQSGRNAHVHARYFYVRDLAYSNQTELIHLPTELQLADIGCTYKGGPTFIYLCNLLIECARIMIDVNGNPFWERMTDNDA
jgi:hypothetical protein